MNNKFKSFLILGALALTVQTNVMAQSNTVSESLPQQLETISTSINNIVKSQFDKGYLTEKADISVNIVSDRTISAVNMDDPDQKSTEINIKADLSANHFFRLSNICKIVLSFDENGKVPYLGLDDKLEILTSLQNEKQKEYMQQFFALHEHFHCEFSGIQNPINFSEKSWFFNNKLNKNLKEISPVLTGSSNLYSSYMETLNESFADTSASMALIKQYGIEDKDLLYVLKVISAQREDNYLERTVDTHFTNFALEELLSDKIIKRLEKVSDGKDFKNLALEIANNGTEKLLVEKDGLAEGMFSVEIFKNSMIIETAREIKRKLGKEPMQGSESPWSKNLQEGYIREIVLKATKGIDYTKDNLSDCSNVELVGFAMNRLKDVSMDDMGDRYVKYKEITNDFVKAIKEKHQTKSLITDGEIVFSTELVYKIQNLRTKFTEETKSISSIAKLN